MIERNRAGSTRSRIISEKALEPDEITDYIAGAGKRRANGLQVNFQNIAEDELMVLYSPYPALNEINHLTDHIKDIR